MLLPEDEKRKRQDNSIPAIIRSALIFLAAAIVALWLIRPDMNSDNSSVQNTPLPTERPGPPPIEIEIRYSGEVPRYLDKAIVDFNRAYAEGRNPLTGQPLGETERPIVV